MNKRVNIERNRVFHLEDSMIMYGIYNVDTLEKLIQMVHKMNNRSFWFKRLYAGHVSKWFKMYERFVNQLKDYLQAIRILSKDICLYHSYHLQN